MEEKQVSINDLKTMAVFDGWTLSPYENLPNKVYKFHGTKETGIHVKDLNYHNSWDALMPVCKKWDYLSENGMIPDEEIPNYIHWCDNLDDSITRTYDILPAYKRLVECIEWYNAKCIDNHV